MIRLSDCIKETDLENIILKEVEEQNMTKEYFNNILRPQLWWKMTMKMKKDQEGFSEEGENFLKCGFKRKIIRGKADNTRVLEKFKRTLYQDIIKYGFDKRLPIDINNKINREDLPKGYTVKIEPYKKGFKIICTGLKKGAECLNFSGLNFDNSIININKKSFRGFDSIVINGRKIKTSKKPNIDYIKNLCSKENNTIEFIKNEPFTKYSYESSEPKDIFITAFDRLKRVQYVDKNEYNVYGFSKGKNKFIGSGQRAKIYDLKSLNKIQDVNRIQYKQISRTARKVYHRLESSSSPLISPKDKRAIALRYGNEIQVFNIEKDIFEKTIVLEEKISNLNFFLNETNIIMTNRKKVIVYDIEKEKTIFSKTPKFTDFSKKYRTTHIEKILLSNDKTKIFIISNKNHIEIWSIENNKLKYQKSLNIKYHIDGVSTYPKDKDILVLRFIGKDILFWDTAKDKSVRTLKYSKGYKMSNFIFSSDNRYMIGYGQALYLWDLEKDELVDFMKKELYGMKGAIFIHDSHKFITIDKDVEMWTWQGS
ncbi:hypothetical protein MNB_SV-6-1583 [hydrothermal vent metagenome]|uniref:Uncharacterized protein n=1 Tax=hydrothermal vent metagenome TaxID=652676 RepID=A0A1W1C316_9ZZZZ